jgi:predicted MPP superfamily phosphohydrolase
MAKIWLLSDLHRDVSPWDPPPIPRADVAVVAGDVGQGLSKSVAWAADVIRPHMPVVMVAGNHEFYGGAHDEQLQEGRRAAAARDVHLLENDAVDVAGTTFAGATLWTDYLAEGDARRRANREAARVGMRDHRRITWRKRPQWKRFRPEEAEALHAESLAFLGETLTDRSARSGRPAVVVTHHAPSTRSIAPQFQGDPLNASFVSDLDAFILRTRPTLWLHGHVHASFDYRIGDTRVICNPRGYDRENPSFDPKLLISLAP